MKEIMPTRGRMVTRGGTVYSDWGEGPQYYNGGGEPSRLLNARQVALRDGLATNATPEERTQLQELGVPLFSSENLAGDEAALQAEAQPPQE